MPGRRRTLGSPQEEVTEPRSQEGSGEGGRRVQPGRGGGLCSGPGAGAGGGGGGDSQGPGAEHERVG